MRLLTKVSCSLVVCLAMGSVALAAKPEEDRFAPLKRFSQVMDLVENHYVKSVTRNELIDGAIVGMLQQLDPHSSFLSKEEFKEMQVSTSGEFGGIGIEISMENGRLTVISPIDDTPADKAGIKSGDVILEIEGESTQDMTLVDAVQKIRGPKGKPVALTLIHKDQQKPFKVKVVRDTIPIISVKSNEVEPGYLYVRLTRFNENTTNELKQAISDFQKGGKTLKGVILDLRNNPGGLLEQAVSVSDVFLPSGQIVSIKGKSADQEKVFSAKGDGSDVSVPMAVLINAGSASASEIVAGALKDHKRALLVGEKTFGKGSVQTVIPLSDGSGIKLTTALYYTPNGRSIQAEGIEPDFMVPLEDNGADGDKLAANHQFRERDLSRHLENKKKKAESSDDPKQKLIEQLARDNQLKLALELVKYLPIKNYNQ
ncbi:carboxyl-terminal protease [Solidesulfovibrio carbinoliphilus subsp. oakridgensis]|uniref:Carboxyl-terminal protease n=1 Tax=Solidesulfovibrio carbinoliphilus subsp. oakridgensis TaxID=694327 RepID=G7QCX3_9BACT|nr:S41 family peptidase [Solidesulfovibrio carbinoliphilus]EHJ46279.1 carboxyl-terminal protease [Solidesulfovibrio carbinoliphilus subsp. oakridgensis]